MNRTYSHEELPSVAREVIASAIPGDSATVLAFSGPLGAGKTSLTQAIAVELGVSDRVVSPTFVIAKWYEPTKGGFDTLVHIDAYKIESEEELIPLGFLESIKKLRTLVIIEWPEKISTALSSVPVQVFLIEHENADMRKIQGPVHTPIL